MFPSLSTVSPCGNKNISEPKLFRSLPDGSNSRIGARVEPSQVFAPHRSATQIFPRLSTSTPAVAPQVLPSGSLAQFSIVRYGSGGEFCGARDCASALCAKFPIITTNSQKTGVTPLKPVRQTRGIMALPRELAFQEM